MKLLKIAKLWSHRNDTSNCFTLENKNTEHAACTINSDSF
jgi:hypothetical protein